MKEDLIMAKKEIKELKEHSLAWEMLVDQKKQNKRLFIIVLFVLIMWFLSICLFVYYIKTTSYEVITETAETDGEGNACIGDNCNNGVINGKGD